jgi:hypothetical protein
MSVVKLPSNNRWVFSNTSLAFFLMIFWFLVVKEHLEVFGLMNYYFYFLPMAIPGALFFFRLGSSLKGAGTVEKHILLFFLLFSIFLVKDLLRNDFDGVLEQLKFFLSFAFMYSFSKQFPMNEYNLKSITIFFFLSSVICALLFSRPSLILVPDHINNFRVYIGSIHYSGKMYVFILLAMLYMSYVKFDHKHHFRTVEKFIILALLVLTVMSGSRSAIHIFVVIMFLFLFYRNRKLGLGAVVFAVFFLASIYALPILLDAVIFKGYWGAILKSPIGDQ